MRAAWPAVALHADTWPGNPFHGDDWRGMALPDIWNAALTSHTFQVKPSSASGPAMPCMAIYGYALIFRFW
ncbi:hypothetical protein B0H19DRAFT_1121956 [Mycena capillaripes]|nr:hypothetical protein B0H19DRAFT_1121956 [Mycena capillaripes]